MELNVEVKCLDEKKAGQVRLIVGDVENKTVKDLKQELQNLLGAPICDQVLSYCGRQLNVDSVLLTTLYLRKEDWISVEFPGKADIVDIDDLLKGLKEFSNTVKDNSSKILAVFADRNRCSYFVSYHRVLWSLEKLAFDYFIPWKNARSVANRHYFVQQGGFGALMEAVKFSHQSYKAVQTNSTTRDSEEEKNCLAQVKHLNNEQRSLQMNCLSLLWNFSENRHDRWLVLKNGGLEWVVAALLLNPYGSTDEEEFWQTIRINESAVGCLVQYVELSSCQEVVAKNKEAVNKLVCMVQSLSERNPNPEIYTSYCSQIAANTLFCCACCLSTPRIFADNEVHLKLLRLTQCLMDDERYDLALGYYCCLFLARIRSSPLVTLDSVVARDIDNIIAQFMTLHQPPEISKWEETHNYVWVSVLPFVSLAFAGGWYEQKEDFECATEDTRFDTNGAQDPREQGQRAAYVAHGMSSQSMQEIDGSTVEDSSHDYDVKGQGSCYETGELSPQPDASRPDHTGEHVMCCKSLAATCQDSVPSGRQEDDRGVDRLFTWPGSLQMQRFGVFTLKHMLHSKENVEILKSEGLLPYVVCLVWHLHQPERDLVKEELRSFGQIETPSLKVISKSALARMNGLETVYKM